MPAFLPSPPDAPSLTDYDRAHIGDYLRLLDAEAAGAGWNEAATVIFGADRPDDENTARAMHAAHLARAQWLARQGYRELAAESVKQDEGNGRDNG
jgi:hypothetical protein